MAAVTVWRRDKGAGQPSRPASLAPFTDVEGQILEYLTARPGVPIKTSQVVRDTGHAKLLINQTLYALLKKGLLQQTPGSPPQWLAPATTGSVAPKSAPATLEPYVIVYIDAGNIHTVLQNVIPYAEQDVMEVRFYADLAFNGFGLNPKVECKNVTIFHAKTADKNSADVALIWDVCRLVDRLHREQPTRELQAYCVTLDLQFQSLKSLVEENPLHKLTFCTTWEALRDHIEG